MRNVGPLWENPNISNDVHKMSTERAANSRNARQEGHIFRGVEFLRACLAPNDAQGASIEAKMVHQDAFYETRMRRETRAVSTRLSKRRKRGNENFSLLFRTTRGLFIMGASFLA